MGRQKYFQRVEVREFNTLREVSVKRGDYIYKLQVGHWDNHKEKNIKICYYHKTKNGNFKYVPNAPTLEFDVFFELLKKAFKNVIGG